MTPVSRSPGQKRQGGRSCVWQPPPRVPLCRCTNAAAAPVAPPHPHLAPQATAVRSSCAVGAELGEGQRRGALSPWTHILAVRTRLSVSASLLALTLPLSHTRAHHHMRAPNALQWTPARAATQSRHTQSRHPPPLWSPLVGTTCTRTPPWKCPPSTWPARRTALPWRTRCPTGQSLAPGSEEGAHAMLAPPSLSLFTLTLTHTVSLLPAPLDCTPLAVGPCAHTVFVCT